MPFLWDSLRLPYGAEEISQITHGFSTGMMNVLWVYAADAASFTGLDLPNCVVSFPDGWWIDWYGRVHHSFGLLGHTAGNSNYTPTGTRQAQHVQCGISYYSRLNSVVWPSEI